MVGVDFDLRPKASMLSSVPALTTTLPGISAVLARIGEPQPPQKWRSTG
ncbi:hypothetical protein [Bradyrhizobium tropiciagri]|nr:hypothetical protein [Bradyrhizobium tropiciagri]